MRGIAGEFAIQGLNKRLDRNEIHILLAGVLEPFQLYLIMAHAHLVLLHTRAVSTEHAIAS